jgi:tetratricopeptide (TPR) repeat protein
MKQGSKVVSYRITYLVIGVLLSLVAGRPARADEPSDKKMFERVMSRLLASDVAAKEYPGKYLWPPRHQIMPDSDKIVNAFASASEAMGAQFDEKANKIRPIVTVTQGMLREIIKGDENSLAVIMGHELAHLCKDHVAGRKGDTAVLFLAFGREQEVEADLNGLRYAIAAGYPYRTGVASAINAMRKQEGITSFEGLSSTHPTWEERLALLDREQPKLWSSMSAFRNGFLFLDLEQYLAAQQCFKAVLAEFPDCYEAWANLGYAELMRYCDGLDTDDVRQYGIGPIAVGGFYARPASLESKVRGIDEKLWKDAVKALNKAIALKPELALPRASLGIAYLVHPEGKQAKKAGQYFKEALDRVERDPEARDDLVIHLSILANAASADLAQGNVEGARKKFEEAGQVRGKLRLSRVLPSLEDALLYNQALVEARSADKENKLKAYQMLGDYLQQASPDSAWWPLGYDHYAKLAKEAGQAAKSRQELAQRKEGARMRLLVSVGSAKDTIHLAQPTKDAAAHLGKCVVELPLFPGSKIARWRSAERGIDLLAKDRVLAIFLTNSKAPPVVLQARGPATKSSELRVGMTQRAAEDLLKNQPAEKGKLAIADPNVEFFFYPDLGLGIRYENHVVKELAIAQVPRLFFAD